MEFFIFVGAGIVILLFAAIRMALSSENKTKAQHELAKAELEKAKAERENAKVEAELSLKRQELIAANERALTLSRARDSALQQIMDADLESKNQLTSKVLGLGGLEVLFDDGSNPIDKGAPRISWKWTPFENAVVKILRNEGTILETIPDVIAQATLIHVEQFDPEGFYNDKEAKAGHTYNYYAFIETRRTGVRAQPITLELPAEVRSGTVIDENGVEITEFRTVQPEPYEEPFYHGFRYRRLTVDKYLDELAQSQVSLDLRRKKLELAEEDMELQKLEREIGLRSGNLNSDHLRKLIEEAKRITGRGAAIGKAEEMLNEMDDVDEHQREIILAYIRKNIYR